MVVRAEAVAVAVAGRATRRGRRSIRGRLRRRRNWNDSARSVEGRNSPRGGPSAAGRSRNAPSDSSCSKITRWRSWTRNTSRRGGNDERRRNEGETTRRERAKTADRAKPPSCLFHRLTSENRGSREASVLSIPRAASRLFHRLARAKPPSCLFHRLASLSSHVLVSRVPPRASGGARVGSPVDERRREDSSLAIFFAV